MSNGGRKTQIPAIHEISRTINFNDNNVAGGLLVGTLPTGARVLRTQVIAETAFNAATTNTISVGKTGAGTDFVNAQSVTAAGLTTVAAPIAAVVQAADQAVYASYAQTGAAATAGVATVVVEYLAAVG